jgi:hypothetical protein
VEESKVNILKFLVKRLLSFDIILLSELSADRSDVAVCYHRFGDIRFEVAVLSQLSLGFIELGSAHGPPDVSQESICVSFPGYFIV